MHSEAGLMFPNYGSKSEMRGEFSGVQHPPGTAGQFTDITFMG